MKKLLQGMLCLACILSLCACKGEEVMENTESMVLTMQEEVGDNAVWCGSFQLVWNTLKDTYNNGNDIIFKDGKNTYVEYLNTSSFDHKDISEDSYYVTSGYARPELKKEIERAIKDKFNQKSDILDGFTFVKDSYDLFLYAMLYKEFSFKVAYDSLDTDTFEGKEANYFGIAENSKHKEELQQQISVLYYEDEDHFAICLHTEKQDNVYITRGIEENTFNDIYKTMLEKGKAYDGFAFLTNTDTFKMPCVDIKNKTEFNTLCNHPMDITVEGTKKEYSIDKALQTIQFSLNEKGGKVKSEAGMSLKVTSLPPEEERHFDVTGSFALFLQEEKADTPYLALKVTDIDFIQ